MAEFSDLTLNPLVNPPKVPHEAPAFDLVKAEHYTPAIDWAIAKAREEIEAIKNNEAPPTFANTIEALDFAGEDLSRIGAIFSSMTMANITPALKAIETDIQTKMVRYGNDVRLDDVLFARIEALHNDFSANPQKYSSLSDDQKLLLTDTYKSFVKNGALLQPQAKQKLRDIGEKLTQAQTKYKNNLQEDAQARTIFIDDETLLDGVPDRAKNIYKELATEAKQPDKWMIPMSPAYFSDITEYATNRNLRQRVSETFATLATSGAYDNRPILMDIVKLRHEKATLLGHNNYADFVLADRMAGSTKTVTDFLDKNLAVYKPAAEKHLQAVKDYALQIDGITDFKPYDFAYYERKLQEETYKVDLEELRPYFDLEKVLDGLRQHAEKLFNIELKETAGKYPVYHPDVKVYEVHDQKNGEIIGLFYADYYARNDDNGAKKEGAWEDGLRGRGLNSKRVNEFPFVMNVCNFTKPTATEPTLLALEDVRTVFHEFGHALHDLLAQGNYKSQTGTNVKWDFVELPSQLQENWVRQKEVLDTFARHKDTGQPLPASLIKKAQDMENFGVGYTGLRQTCLGMLDMKWYTTDPATITSVESLEDSVWNVASLTPRTTGLMSTRFSHIFAGGYAAGYYSYKWAEVLEADVFAEFQQRGLYDRATANRLRDTIYSKGGTVEPDKLFRDFRGRDPDPNALFRREGLLPQTGQAPQQPKPPAGPSPS